MNKIVYCDFPYSRVGIVKAIVTKDKFFYFLFELNQDLLLIIKIIKHRQI